MVFEYFDTVSPKNHLFFQGHQKHISFFGGILTLISYIVIIFFFYQFTKDTFFKQNPNVYYFSEYSPEIGSYPFSSSSIFHFFQLLNKNDQPTLSSEYFTAIGTEQNPKDLKELNDITKKNFWVYDSCSERDFLYYNQELKYESNFSSSLCVKKFYNATTKLFVDSTDENFIFPKLMYGISNNNNIGYGIYLIRCFNNEILTRTCKSNDEINNYEKQVVSIRIGIINHYFDPNDFNNPLKSYLFSLKNYLSRKFFINYNMYLSPLEIRSNDGFLFNSQNTLNSYRFDYKEKDFYEKEEFRGILSSWYFLIQNRVDIFERNYQKIQYALANVVGASRAVIFFCEIINYFINKYVTFNDIQETLYKYAFQHREENKKRVKTLNISSASYTLNNLVSSNSININQKNAENLKKTLRNNAKTTYSFMEKKNTFSSQRGRNTSINNIDSSNQNSFLSPVSRNIPNNSQLSFLLNYKRKISFKNYILGTISLSHRYKAYMKSNIQSWKKKVSEEALTELSFFMEYIKIKEQNKKLPPRKNKVIYN